MKPRLRPSPTLFALVVIIAIVICFPAIWCQETWPYEVCRRSVRCGNIELEYPFWGLDRPAYCGHSGFELTCQSNVPLLNYDSVEYQVLETDSSTKTITVARNDLWSNFCPRYLHNTTYNHTLFNGNNFGQQNVSLFYGCNITRVVREGIYITLVVSNNYLYECDVNGTQSDGYFYRTNLIMPRMAIFYEQCNDSITVPVSRSSGDRIGSDPATTSDLRSALTAGFNLQWMAYNDECDQCVRSNGQCGSNTTSSVSFACYCATGNFSLTCNNTNQIGGSKGANKRIKLIIGILSSIAGIMVLLFVMLCRKKLLRKTRLHGMPHHLGTVRDHQIEIFIRNYGTLAPKRFTYSEIKNMTNSFFEILGQGGYGSVYKGQLPDGKLVAVKLLSEATGDGEDFINEVASICRTSHVNIVTLLGFCIERKKRALLYEFMPNGSLDKFLPHDGSHLDWNTLFQIAKGIARGLEYLHIGCNTRIVHFDIKPHNILLDEEFIPKISDFGLAKLCKKKESIVSVSGARGTAGYIAPEVFFKSLGGASHKSDVYSYGMMVLEMTGASKNVHASLTSASEAYFPDWIYKQVEAGGNLGVHGLTNEVEEEIAKKMVMVGLWCIQSDPSDRPSISKVVEMLEGSSESLQVPPRRFWSSPTRPAQGTSPLAAHSSTSEGLLTVQAVGEAISS